MTSQTSASSSLSAAEMIPAHYNCGSTPNDTLGILACLITIEPSRIIIISPFDSKELTGLSEVIDINLAVMAGHLSASVVGHGTGHFVIRIIIRSS